MPQPPPSTTMNKTTTLNTQSNEQPLLETLKRARSLRPPPFFLLAFHEIHEVASHLLISLQLGCTPANLLTREVKALAWKVYLRYIIISTKHGRRGEIIISIL